MDNENPQQEEKTNELIIRQQRISNTAQLTFRKKKKKKTCPRSKDGTHVVVMLNLGGVPHVTRIRGYLWDLSPMIFPGCSWDLGRMVNIKSMVT